MQIKCICSFLHSQMTIIKRNYFDILWSVTFIICMTYQLKIVHEHSHNEWERHSFMTAVWYLNKITLYVSKKLFYEKLSAETKTKVQFIVIQFFLHRIQCHFTFFSCTTIYVCSVQWPWHFSAWSICVAYRFFDAATFYRFFSFLFATRVM